METGGCASSLASPPPITIERSRLNLEWSGVEEFRPRSGEAKIMEDISSHRIAASPVRFRGMRVVGRIVMWFILVLLTLWAVAALYVDFRTPALRIPVTVIYVV